MRLRDKLFPEGTKIRFVLRKILFWIKSIKIKIKNKIINLCQKKDNKNIIKDENFYYQELLNRIEPTQDELQMQKNTKFK